MSEETAGKKGVELNGKGRSNIDLAIKMIKLQKNNELLFKKYVIVILQAIYLPFVFLMEFHSIENTQNLNCFLSWSIRLITIDFYKNSIRFCKVI